RPHGVPTHCIVVLLWLVYRPGSRRTVNSKALELEQSQSSRKTIEKERSLKSLAKSFTIWLNFLFQNPGSCRYELAVGGGNGDQIEALAKGRERVFPG
ncbi:LOW QUALITY PROTEIN: hypothetical protein PanWU01x14_165960, partial [Parasponia andersonii]